MKLSNLVGRYGFSSLLGSLVVVLAAGWAGCGGSEGDEGGTIGPLPGTGGSGGSDAGKDSSTPTCPSGLKQCGNQCVDTRYDPANCGACSTKCDTGEFCSNGTCGGGCTGGSTQCGDACTNTATDVNNCGGCGTKCADGELCSAGKCGVSCGGGTDKCGSTCVDLNNDPANCGTCATKCADGELCSAGKCSMNCGGGTEKCGTACVDTDNDPANCGGCDKPCASGEVCSAGVCGLNCGGGTTKCGTECVNTSTDPAHCGGCDKPCGSGQVCSGGQCNISCGAGTQLCGTNCVNVQIDPANCGGCDKPCAAGEVCSAGVCGFACAGGTTKCGNACVNLQIDPANCGACATVCNAGDVCSAGTCGFICAGGTTKCGTTCVNTAYDPSNCGSCGNICPVGQVCNAGACGLNCSGGLTKCGDTCVNTQTDPANCGVCGTVCAAGQVCNTGVCGSDCTGGLTKCGTQCVDMQTDEANCGTCAKVCAAGETCSAGACVGCDSATTDCDKDGWLVSEGDCCDKPGICGAEPAKVNPGAIEVKGNGIDDNCNGKTDLFDSADTVACDTTLASDSSVGEDYAKAMGICRTTVEAPALKKDKTWGLISAQLLRADGTPLAFPGAKSIRPSFGGVAPAVIEGQRVAVLSSGIAADATQTNPGPNGGPGGGNVDNAHTPASSVNIQTCSQPYCIKDWYATPNLPLKPANGLPDSPGCSTSDTAMANDSVMLVLRMRAPTNARAFSFNSYFISAEYPEYVCTTFNDQFIALVDTPSGTPSPIPNPADKNLMTYTSGGQKWPIGINIAKGTDLFSVCESQTANPGCWDTSVSATSCSLGFDQLTGTGFEKNSGCLIGGGTFWLTTAGNVIPGEIVELRVALWDVGDSAYDSLAILDGFSWLANATLPGTGN